MKATKRILALLTAALLALSLTGCLVSKDEAGTDDPAAANTTDAANAPDAATDKPSGNAGDSSFDREAVAIELGDVQIKAGEISDVFDQYIGLFGYSGTVDGETVSQCLDMTLDYTLRYYLPLWKANELGVTLTEADEAEIEAIARAEVDEEALAAFRAFR